MPQPPSLPAAAAAAAVVDRQFCLRPVLQQIATQFTECRTRRQSRGTKPGGASRRGETFVRRQTVVSATAVAAVG